MRALFVHTFIVWYKEEKYEEVENPLMKVQQLEYHVSTETHVLVSNQCLPSCNTATRTPHYCATYVAIGAIVFEL